MRNCWLKQVPLKMHICILADSYQVNKTEYRVHVFIESLYNDTLESYSKNMQENFVLYSSVFCKKKKNSRIHGGFMQCISTSIFI